MTIRPYVVTAAVSLGLGAAGALYLRPPRVEVRTEYQTREVVVTKLVRERTKQQTKQRTESRPDGTRIEETTTTRVDTATEKDGSKMADTRTITVERSKPLDWRVGGMVGWDFRDGQLAYGGGIERRILGPIWLGVWGLSSGIAGGSVGVTW